MSTNNWMIGACRSRYAGNPALAWDDLCDELDFDLKLIRLSDRSK